MTFFRALFGSFFFFCLCGSGNPDPSWQPPTPPSLQSTFHIGNDKQQQRESLTLKEEGGGGKLEGEIEAVGKEREET